jgi:phage-related holin
MKMAFRLKIPALQLFDYFCSPFVLSFSISLGVIKNVFGEYVFEDWKFAAFLFILMIVDTVLGFFRAWTDKRVSDEGFGKILKKFIVYSSVLIVAHVMTHFVINGQKSELFNWVDDTLFIVMMLKEAISIFKNIALLMPDFLPKKLIEKLEGIEDQILNK